MINQVILIGKILKIKKQESGLYLLLDVERDYKSSDGTFEHDQILCTHWKGISESIAQYYKEGQYISVVGRLQSDENGKSIVVGEKVNFIGRTTKGAA